jgi:predicted 3-demethylubiquinone-9 3-methyltransferase (glyoxalase superfamily)
VTVQLRPHLWFDTQAVEAATFYAETFPDSKVTGVSQIRDTPSGDVDIVSFEVLGQGFQAISAGPLFQFNPSISFLVRCSTPDEVDALWTTLSAGGEALMPLDAYPFSKRYGWTMDRYGLSWQLMLDDGAIDQRLATMLLFVGDACGKAEEAMQLYTSLLPDSRIDAIQRHEGSEGPDAPAIASRSTKRSRCSSAATRRPRSIASGQRSRPYPKPSSADGSRTASACPGRSPRRRWTRCSRQARPRRSIASRRRSCR